MKTLRILFALFTTVIILTACTSDFSTNEGGESSITRITPTKTYSLSDVTKKEIKEYPQRPLAKDQGFTGWLDATGQFHECTYGTHNEIAHNHNITNDDSAIYFACATSPISNSLTDVAETGYLKPTQAQLDWLETYKEQMSPTQREMLDIK